MKIGRVIGRFFGVLLIFLSIVTQAQQEVVPRAEFHGSARVPQNSADCALYLDGTRIGLIASLEARISENRRREIDFLAAVPRKQIEAEHFRDLGVFASFRSHAVAASISFNPTSGDFEETKALYNSINQSLDTAQKHEREEVWQDFAVFQREHLNQWWQKESRAFPRWQNCLVERNGALEFENRPGRVHVLQPKSRELDASISYSTRKDCAEVKSRWAQLPYAPELVAKFVAGNSGANSRKSQASESFKDWMFYLRRDPAALNADEKRTLIARAYGDLNKDLVKLVKWLKNLKGSDLSQLLALKKVREDFNGGEICQEQPSTTWPDLVQRIGINFLLPGYDVGEHLLFAGPQNDRMFIAGFISHTTWENTENELRRNAALSMIAGPAGGAAWTKVIGKLAPIAKRALSRVNLPEVPIHSFHSVPAPKIPITLLMKKYDLSPRANTGQPVVFGQKAVSPGFFNGGTMKGARLNDIASKVGKGELTPEDLVVRFIWVNGEKVAINNRSLTVVAKAGKKPIEIDMTGKLPQTGPDSLEDVLLRLEEMGGRPARSIGIRSGNTRETPIGETVYLPH